MKRLFISLALLISVGISLTAQSVDAKLNIGDKAPEIKYGKWLKGTPITRYEPNRLYIVEFWATWCGPCIASMPHLSQFAAKNKDFATVIGVDIWEGAHGDSSKLYESFLPKVSKFVKGMGDKMAYNVAMDNNDQFMANNWMKAAGQEGIPCSFIIKNGTILWIGHPIDLDSVVNIVNSDSYNVMAARKAQVDRNSSRAQGMDPFKATYGAYEEAMKQKDFKRALFILDSAINRELGMVTTFSFFKFQTLLENVSEDSAMAFVKEWRRMKNPGYTASTGVVICRKAGLSKETYQYGIDLLKSLIETQAQIPAMMYNEIAGAYKNMGDYNMAIDTQQKAVDLAKQALKDGKYTGFILEDTVKDYEKKLEEYKKLKK